MTRASIAPAIMKIAIGALTATTVFAAPLAVNAQSPVPSYARSDEAISGRVSSIDGKYRISVRDDRGYIDNVDLHDGTIINPTGLTLHAGQAVTIHGYADRRSFVANEIDTPYNFTYAAGYPYGGYGYPYYSNIGIGFGFGGFDRGYGFRGGYRR